MASFESNGDICEVYDFVCQNKSYIQIPKLFLDQEFTENEKIAEVRKKKNNDTVRKSFEFR